MTLSKCKQFSARCPFKEMVQMLLTICLSTMNLTATAIKDALETISFAEVEVWLDEVFGQPMLSKTRTPLEMVTAIEAKADLEFWFSGLMEKNPCLFGGSLPKAGFYYS